MTKTHGRPARCDTGLGLSNHPGGPRAGGLATQGQLPKAALFCSRVSEAQSWQPRADRADGLLEEYEIDCVSRFLAATQERLRGRMGRAVAASKARRQAGRAPLNPPRAMVVSIDLDDLATSSDGHDSENNQNGNQRFLFCKIRNQKEALGQIHQQHLVADAEQLMAQSKV